MIKWLSAHTNLPTELWPVLTIEETNKHFSITIHFRQAFLLVGILTHFALALLLLLSCQLHFDCSQFWPTLSYLAAFPMYDRAFSFILATSGLMLVLFHICAWVYLHPRSSRVDSIGYLAAGLLSAVALPALAVIDEISSSSLIYLAKVHLLLIGSIFSLKAVWLAYTLRLIFQHRTYSRFIFPIGYSAILCLAVYFAYKAWRYQPFEDQAMSEYLAVSLGVYLPFIYSLTFRGVSVKVSANAFSIESAVLS